LPGKAAVFIVGVLTGAATTANWRPLIKRGVKTAVSGTAKVARAAEDVTDIVHDVRAEVIREGREQHVAAFAAANGDVRR
jgi:hypothetical protein